MAKVFAYYYFVGGQFSNLVLNWQETTCLLILLFHMDYSPMAKEHRCLNGLFSVLNTSIRSCNIFRVCMA